MNPGDRPDISVVVACHNAARTVAETAASVFRQTHPGWELICIDDGSSDETPRILASLAQSQPRLRWRRVPHGGPSAARNVGAASATGRYVLVLDSDDVLRPDALETLLHAARTANSDTLIAGGWELLDTHGRPLGVLRFPAVRAFTVDEFLLGNRISVVTLVPRHLLGTRPFDETLETCIDWDLWLRLAHRGARCRTIPRVVFGYRLHGTSLSRRCETVYASGRRVIRRWLPHARNPAAVGGALGRWTVGQAALALAAGDAEACRRRTRELRALSLPAEPAREIAGALHYAFAFVRGAAGATWTHRTEPWLAECAQWLETGPLAMLAGDVLAELRALVAAQGNPVARLRAALQRRAAVAPVDRLVIYGLGNNGVTLREHLRSDARLAALTLCGADDFADEHTFALLDLLRTDPRRWRSWPRGTFVVVTPDRCEPMVETLRAAGGRPGEDFLILVDSRSAVATPPTTEALV